MPHLVRRLLPFVLVALLAACNAAAPAGDATVPVGPEGLEGDL
jgi:hypothetical protein